MGTARSGQRDCGARDCCEAGRVASDSRSRAESRHLWARPARRGGRNKNRPRRGQHARLDRPTAKGSAMGGQYKDDEAQRRCSTGQRPEHGESPNGPQRADQQTTHCSWIQSLSGSSRRNDAVTLACVAAYHTIDRAGPRPGKPGNLTKQWREASVYFLLVEAIANKLKHVVSALNANLRRKVTFPSALWLPEAV